MAGPDLASPRFKANPYAFYARLRAEAPVHRTRLAYWGTTWVVSRYDDVVGVLRDGQFAKDFSSKLRWVPRAVRPLHRNLLSADPPDHTRLRTLVSKAFTPRVVERLRGRIQDVCDRLLDAGEAGGRLDLVRGFALTVPLTIIADLLGIPARDRRRFFSWSKVVAAATSGAAFDLARALPALWLSTRYFRGLVSMRRADPGDDVVTELLRAEEAGDKLDGDEVIGMIALLLVGGYETTMNLIATGALALIRHPGQRRQFLENPALVESAVEELLRYASPADFATFRVARDDVVIRSVPVPRGDLVLAALTSANRDESQFPDPDTLDITRQPNRHVAFGAGPHFCLGASLARLEAQVALTALFRRFPNVRLAEPPETLRWRRGLLFRGLEELPVVPGGRER